MTLRKANLTPLYRVPYPHSRRMSRVDNQSRALMPGRGRFRGGEALRAKRAKERRHSCRCLIHSAKRQIPLRSPLNDLPLRVLLSNGGRAVRQPKANAAAPWLAALVAFRRDHRHCLPNPRFSRLRLLCLLHPFQKFPPVRRREGGKSRGQACAVQRLCEILRNVVHSRVQWAESAGGATPPHGPDHVRDGGTKASGKSGRRHAGDAVFAPRSARNDSDCSCPAACGP